MIRMAYVCAAALILSAPCNGEHEEKFKEFKIVSEIIDKAPIAEATVKYPEAKVNLGELIDPEKTRIRPTITWPYEEEAKYTLIMIDPDYLRRGTPIGGSYLHWLIMNVPGNNINDGESIASYQPPSPFPFTDIHRYIFLIYKQYESTQSPDMIERFFLLGRVGFDLRSFTTNHGLTLVVAGNFYTSGFSSNQ